MTDLITLFQKTGLVKSGYSYSETSNSFLTSGYTSAAGNTYFNSIRAAEGIIIKEDVGQGYCRTFLNGLKIYSTKDKILLADKSFSSLFYSKHNVKYYSKLMLLQVLRDAAKNEDHTLDENEANRILDKVLDEAMNTDQRELAMRQTRKYLK